MTTATSPLQRARDALAEFFRLEAAGGILLVGAALLALLVANSPLSAAYQANPKTSTTPNDSQRSDGYRLRPGVALPLTDTLRFEAEVSYDRQNQHANYVSFSSQADRTRDNWSVPHAWPEPLARPRFGADR